MYITRKDFRTHGYIRGCQGCLDIASGRPGPTSNFPQWRGWSVIRGNEAETSTSSRSTAKRLDIAGVRRAQTLAHRFCIALTILGTI